MKRKKTQVGFSQISAKFDSLQIGARKDVTDVLRTVFWYEGLLLQTKEKTAYRLAKIFDPDLFGIKDGVPFNSGKWQKYAKGENTPSSQKVMVVDLVASGSASEINHVLWKVLRLKYRSTAANITSSLRQLDPSIQSVIYGRKNADGSLTRNEVNLKCLDTIVQRGSIDSLACLTILLREAAFLPQEKLAFEIALRIHQVLLILGAAFYERRIGDALVQLFSERIFPLVRWKEYRFYIENEKFIESSYLLNELSLGAKSNSDHSWGAQVKKMRNILEGRHGFHLSWAMQPLYGPSPSEANSAEILQFTRRRSLYTKAWEIVYSKYRKVCIDVEDKKSDFAVENFVNREGNDSHA